MLSHQIIAHVNALFFEQSMHLQVFSNVSVQGNHTNTSAFIKLVICCFFLSFEKSRCVCNYEVRNTTTMKVVVIMIMVAISLLFIYMIFLLCLDPLMNQNTKGKKTANASSATRPKHHDRAANDEVHVDNPTQECVFSEPSSGTLQNNRHRSSTVLNLVTHEQSKWRKQVDFKFKTNYYSLFA